MLLATYLTVQFSLTLPITDILSLPSYVTLYHTCTHILHHNCTLILHHTCTFDYIPINDRTTTPEYACLPPPPPPYSARLIGRFEGLNGMCLSRNHWTRCHVSLTSNSLSVHEESLLAPTYRFRVGLFFSRGLFTSVLRSVEQTTDEGLLEVIF